MNWNDVAEIGGKLPGVEVSTWYGTPALKVGGKGFCRMREGPDALVIRVGGLEEKEAMLAGNPDAYFTTSHYDGHPMLLVNLDVVDRGELAELIEDAWLSRGGRPIT